MNKPEDRARLIEERGPTAYAQALEAWRNKRTIRTVNGHAIRWLITERFGVIYEVGDTGRAFLTVDHAVHNAEVSDKPLGAAIMNLAEAREINRKKKPRYPQ